MLTEHVKQEIIGINPEEIYPMKKLLLTAAMLGALSAPAYADVLLQFDALQTLVSQSKSNPCIICATQSASQPDLFGFNNFINTGSTDGGTFFSTAQVGGSLGDGVEAGAIPYTVGQIGAALLDNFTFGVAIDVNSAEGKPPMTLDSFRLFRVDANLTTIDVLAHYDGPTLMPDLQQGNGFADYILTGFDLSGLNLGDRLIFRATFSGGTDGGESFYLVAQQVPGPIAGAGIPGILAGCMALWGLARNRKRKKELGVA